MAANCVQPPCRVADARSTAASPRSFPPRCARARARCSTCSTDDAYYERADRAAQSDRVLRRPPAGLCRQHADQEGARRSQASTSISRRSSRAGSIRKTEAAAVARGNPAWPSRDAVRGYAGEADALIEAAIATAISSAPDHPLLRGAQALWAILEHEEMHQETLAYMWHQLPYERKRKPRDYRTCRRRLSHAPRPRDVRIPAGAATLGSTRERRRLPGTTNCRAHRVDVAAFTIDVYNVTNARVHGVRRRGRLSGIALVARRRLGVGAGARASRIRRSGSARTTGGTGAGCSSACRCRATGRSTSRGPRHSAYAAGAARGCRPKRSFIARRTDA